MVDEKPKGSKTRGSSDRPINGHTGRGKVGNDPVHSGKQDLRPADALRHRESPWNLERQSWYRHRDENRLRTHPQPAALSRRPRPHGVRIQQSARSGRGSSVLHGTDQQETRDPRHRRQSDFHGLLLGSAGGCSGMAEGQCKHRAGVPLGWLRHLQCNRPAADTRRSVIR